MPRALGFFIPGRLTIRVGGSSEVEEVNPFLISTELLFLIEQSIEFLNPDNLSKPH